MTKKEMIEENIYQHKCMKYGKLFAKKEYYINSMEQLLEWAKEENNENI